MRIFSWNVNGIRAAERKGFLDWLQKEKADVICLQETKARPEQLSEDLLKPSGYFTFWHCAEKPGYSSVSIYTKKEPETVLYGMGLDIFDREGRVLTADYGDVAVVSAYFPNSQREGLRLPYKLDFCRAIHKFCDSLKKKGKHVVLAGDYNIAHKAIDLKNPKSNENNAGYLPEERAWMDEFTQAGYVDTFREFEKGPDHYTWWSYRRNVREKNIGWRIDYFCVNPEFKDRLKASKIHPQVMGSDHCPIELTLKT